MENKSLYGLDFLQVKLPLLANVVTYTYNSINVKTKKRKEKSFKLLMVRFELMVTKIQNKFL